MTSLGSIVSFGRLLNSPISGIDIAQRTFWVIGCFEFVIKLYMNVQLFQKWQLNWFNFGSFKTQTTKNYPKGHSNILGHFCSNLGAAIGHTVRGEISVVIFCPTCIRQSAMHTSHAKPSYPSFVRSLSHTSLYGTRVRKYLVRTPRYVWAQRERERKVGCKQCDQIGQFLLVSETNFIAKVAQIF